MKTTPIVVEIGYNYNTQVYYISTNGMRHGSAKFSTIKEAIEFRDKFITNFKVGKYCMSLKSNK